jgi:cell wall-associated NlpC family hydrolase
MVHRLSSHRLRGALGIAAALLVAFPAAGGSTASADTLLAQKQREQRHVQAQLKALDARAEALTEQYDRAVWQLHVLKRQIAESDVRLAAARAELVQEQAMLSQLLVSQYKGGGGSQTMSLVLGASSLSQVTAGLDFVDRFDTAATDTVQAIASARDVIAHERVLLVIDRRHVRAQKLAAARRKIQIERQMVTRRSLVKELGIQVQLLEQATTVAQGKTALDVRKWTLEDERVNAADPGQLIRDQVVLQGLDQIGVPYVWGGASPTQGFDCSGLVMWLWAHHGVALPHFAAAQYALGPVVEKGPGIDLSKLQPGDLLFFHDLGHVGIYVGNGYVLHAPHTGTVVQVNPLSWGWFQSTFVGATRPGPA